MCRHIRTLFNFEPPATPDEVKASAVQFVRKLSGFTNPSKANEAAFERAVGAVTEVSRTLLGELVAAAPPKDREIEAAKGQAIAELYQRSVQLASLMAGKAIRREINPGDHARLIEESLAELKVRVN